MIMVDVPERISRDDLRRVVESLGMDLDDLVALRFELDGIHAVIHARNANGEHYRAGDELAKHEIRIPLED